MATGYRRDDAVEPEESGRQRRGETGSPGDGTGTVDGTRAPRRGSAWGRGSRWGVVVLASLLILVLGFVIFLQTEWGRGWVQGIAVNEIRGLLDEDAEFSVRRIDGNFITGARMLDVVITEGNIPVIEIDTLVVRYNLLTLFRRTFSASRITVSGLRVWAREGEDGTWNVARILRPVEPRPEVDPYTVRIGDASLRHGLLELHFFHPERDSVLAANPIHLDARDFLSNEHGVRARFDTLVARVTPAVIDPVPIDLRLAGDLWKHEAFLEGLTLVSERSDIRGAGRIGWEEEFWFDADVIGEPFALADLRQFFDVPIYGTANVRLSSDGTPDRIAIRALADFIDHGGFDLDGVIHTARVGDARYQVEGTVTAFDVGSFLANPALAGSVNAEVAFDVGGPSLDELDGPVRLALRGSTVGEQRITRADLTGRFVTGRLDFNLGAVVPGADLVARGAVRPFDDVVPYDVRGEVRNLHLATLLRDPGQDVAIGHATFHFDGRGIELETLAADYAIDATSVRFGELELASARADGSLRQGLLTYDAELRPPADGGLIAGIGTARPFDEPLAFDVQAGRVVNLNVAALTGDPGHDSNLTGTFTAHGVGTEPQTMRLDFTASLEASRFGDFTIVAANATGSMRQSELALDLAANLGDAGSLTAVGSMRPFAEPLTYTFRGRVDNLDLAVLLDDPAQRSDLSGTYTITGAGLDAQTMTAEFALDLEPSTFRGQQLIAGTMEGTLQGGVLIARIDAITPEGRLAFVITTQPFIDRPTVAITEGQFEGLDLALLLDQPALQTDLHGRVELDLTGFDLAVATGRGSIILEPSTINAALLQSGRVEFQLEQGEVTAVAALNFVEGEAGVAFHGRPFDEVPTYSIDARLDSLDVMALVSDQRMTSRVNAVIDITGEGTDPETMTARAHVVMRDSHVPDSYVETLDADIALVEGILIAHQFDLRADFGDATAEGQIALFDQQGATDLYVVAELRDAGPLNALTAEPLFLESAAVDGRFSGPAGGPIAFDGTAIGHRVTYGQFGVQRFDARANVVFDADDEIPFQGRAHVQFDFLALPTFNLRDGDVSLRRIGDDFSAEGRVTVDEQRDLTFRTSFEAIDDPEGPYHLAILVDELSVRLDQDQWDLLQPATISLGDQRYLIRNLVLESNGQQILADGEIDLQGEQTLLVTAEDVRIDLLTDLIGYRGVGGVLTATVDLLGPAEAPILNAVVAIDELTSQGELVGALAADLHYEAEQLLVDATLTHVEGETLVAEGLLPMAIRLDGVDAQPPPGAPVDLTVYTESFPIDWARPFIPPGMVHELDGVLTANVHIGGVFGNPVLDGDIAVADGRLGLEATGDVIFQDIVLVLNLVDNEARIQQAQVRDGRGGLLVIEGGLMLPELAVGELDLHLIMTNFRAINTETYRALTFSAARGQNLRFRGTLTEPELTGNVTLVSGDVYLTEELVGPELEQVDLTEAQIQEIEATFGIRIDEIDLERTAFVDLLDLDVTVGIERNVWLRSRQNPRFDIEFAGNVTAVKPPEAEFQLFGSIDVTRGRVELPTLAARSFNIGIVEGTYGTLIFNGPIEETIVDIRAGMEAPAGIGAGAAAVVYILFEGRLAEEPELTLSSDPPMETADIACVIATGRPCGAAFQGDIAEDIAIGQLGLLVQNIAGRGLGLDVVEVVRRPTGELVITFGSYVTDRTFASISQPVTEARSAVEQTVGMAPEILIEYEILRWLLLRLERRNIGGVGGALFIQFDY